MSYPRELSLANSVLDILTVEMKPDRIETDTLVILHSISYFSRNSEPDIDPIGYVGF